MLEDSRINNKWPFAKEGFPFIFTGLCLTLVFLYLGLVLTSIVAGMLTLFVMFFFRDPDRQNDVHHHAVFAPADGRILEVKRFYEGNNPLGKPGHRISIFMSVFNVHVNRIPVAGTIKKIVYQPGKFFSANLDKASEQNESNIITLETRDLHNIVFIQIAGLIARRIACWIEEADCVEAGQRFGLIRFGSRLEIYLPDDTIITTQKGQKVKAGATVIGNLP
ncbi:MAG: phosphatidylserine decarboxylase family protein [Deltaproteobacteria bacterium]|nr:phosphatidylserine decarboxylase family protein [Deltaproteobacteria bacterium]